MAITHIGGATGTKTTTSGTTISVTYSSAGGNQLFCAIAVAGNTTVNSVTDSAGNAWHLVAALNNGTGVRCELWKTDKTNPVAITSATVTLASTGTRAAAALEEYSNVAFAGASGTNTGSTSPITSGVQTVAESADFLFMAGALAANNTFTQQNGTIENQVGVTAGHVVAIDNTGNTSLTDSATMTAANWAVVFITARALTVTADDNSSNWNDTSISQIGLIIADDNSINWNDVVNIPILISLTDSNNTNWNDTFSKAIPLVLTLSDDDSSNWNDAKILVLGMAIPIQDFTGNGAFSDNFDRADNTSIGTGSSVLWLTNSPDFTGFIVSSNTAAIPSGSSGEAIAISTWISNPLGTFPPFNVYQSWDQFSRAQLLNIANLTSQYVVTRNAKFLSQQQGYLFGWSSSVNSGNYYLAYVDSSGTATTLGTTSIAPQINDIIRIFSYATGADSNHIRCYVNGVLVIEVDDTNITNDAIRQGGAGIRASTASSATQSAFDNWTGGPISSLVGDWTVSSLSLALTLTDDNSVNWNDSDAIFFGLRLSLSDTEISNWNDNLVFSESLQISLPLSDDANNWGEAIATTYGLIITDNGYGQGAYGQIAYGDTTYLQDAAVVQLTTSSVLTENLTDQMSMSDSLLAGFGLATNETLTFLDNATSGYGLITADDLNNWNESITTATVLLESLSDSLNNWLDSLTVGYGNIFSDQLTIIDVVGSTFGLITSDNLNNWSDTPFGIGFGFTDQLILADAVQLTFTFGIGVAETITLLDSLVFGYGLTVAETFTIIDSALIGYGFIISDNDNFWLDDFQFNAGQPELQELASDALTMSDSLAIGYGNIISDQVTITDFSQTGFGLAISEQETLTDAFAAKENLLLSFIETISFTDAQTIGYGLQVTDSSNFWNDLFNFNAGQPGIQLDVSDQLILDDAFAIGFGLGTSEQLIISDAAISEYGLKISDQEILSDSSEIVFGKLVSVSDSFLAFSDAFRVGFGLGITEQLLFSDSAGATYGFVISDSLNFWQDAFTYSGVGTPLLIALSDQIIMADAEALTLGLLSSQSDSMTITDLLLPSMSFGVKTADQFTLADTINVLIDFGIPIGENLNFWNDFIQLQYSFDLSIQDFNTNWLDELEANFVHLLQLADDGSADWQDFVFAGSLFPIEEVLEDGETNNWADALNSAFAQGIGPVTARNISISWQVVASAITVLPRVTVGPNTVTVSPRVTAESITTGMQRALGVVNPFSLSLGDDISRNFLDTVAYTEDIFFSGEQNIDISDLMLLTDETTIENGILFQDDNSQNWEDFTAQILSTTEIDIVLQDSNSNNWQDVGVVSTPDILLALTDDLNNWNEGLIGIGDSLFLPITDDLMNWAEGIVNGASNNIEENINNWNESLKSNLNFQEQLQEDASINLSDLLQLNLTTNFGVLSISVNDRMIMSEILGIGHQYKISDSLIMNDVLIKQPLTKLVLSDDNGGNWSDSFVVPEQDYSITISEIMQMLDYVVTG